ncbi:MAG: DNA mismatch repair endonuclease MutL [Crocinitomicaceae bacterium]|nr:DNA mismatch repair endonuclease MutL [Crocinitomicaceae bacterium]
MKGIIAVLPDHIANQIAAGEVIQRPASVVKELVENAIDAGATKIHINVKDAGRTLIQVSDDGKGMNKMDAEQCFLRHATSKIHSADDLFNLQTKGFRGEALASIASIAHVTLQTKEADKDTGTQILIEGNKIISNEEVVCNKGTNFEVKNLFYNVPARRNFLKSNEVEFRHIRDEFERIALAHPAISFILTNNDTEIYNLRSATLRKRIVDIIGDKQNERLVPIQEETSIVKISGFIIKPEFAKKTRGEQFFFVNNRFFKDAYFNNAVNKGFNNLIQPKTYPGYFIYFDIDPSKIDVNVHPTKTEIKFEEDRNIYMVLLSAIKEALGKYNISPTLDFEQEQSFDIPYDMLSKPVVQPHIKVNPYFNPFDEKPKTSSSTSQKHTALNKFGYGENKTTQQDWENFYNIDELEEKEENIQQVIDIEQEETKFDQFIIRLPYLFFPSKNGLMVIHSKRAFERIIYDEMMREFILHPIAAQTLLFPYEKEVSKGEEDVWMSQTTLLHRLGFESKIEKGMLILNAVPSVLEEEAINTCIDAILDNLSYSTVEKGEIAHILISNIAKSVGNSKVITDNKESITNLVETLFQCEDHSFTPNGKPILKTISLTDIKQLF